MHGCLVRAAGTSCSAYRHGGASGTHCGRRFLPGGHWTKNSGSAASWASQSRGRCLGYIGKAFTIYVYVCVKVLHIIPFFLPVDIKHMRVTDRADYLSRRDTSSVWVVPEFLCVPLVKQRKSGTGTFLRWCTPMTVGWRMLPLRFDSPAKQR